MLWGAGSTPAASTIPGYTRRMRLLSSAAALITLTACMPQTSMPPPIPLPEDSRHQVGLAASEMIEVRDGTSYGLDNARQESLELYTQHRLGERFTLGGQATAGMYSYPVSGRRDGLPFASFGAQVRFSAYETERLALGVSLGGGWIYGQLGAPVALRLGQRFWLGTHPSVHYDHYWYWGGDVPVVAAIQWDQVSVALGSGLRAQQIGSWYATTQRWQHHVYGSLSVARTW